MDSVCTLHMMHPTNPTMEQSVAVIGGVSVCLEHLEKTITALREMQPITAVIMQSLAGDF